MWADRNLNHFIGRTDDGIALITPCAAKDCEVEYVAEHILRRRETLGLGYNLHVQFKELADAGWHETRYGWFCPKCYPGPGTQLPPHKD